MGIFVAEFITAMNIPIESLSLIMLNVGFARHHADWNWQGVSSPFTRLFLVTEGEARIHLPREVVTLHPGRAYMVPAYVTHSYECHGDFALYYLHVYEEFKNEAGILDAYDFPSEIEADEVDMAAFAAICHTYQGAALPSSDPNAYDNTASMTDSMERYHKLPLHDKMRLRGFALLLFSRFVRYAQPRVWTDDERIIRVVSHINEHIAEAITLDELASIGCVTKSYLIRLFTHTMGMSPVRYINRKKMERAQLMLLTEQVPVKEVAYRLGFSDHSYFIRLFRQTVGMSPQEYRRRNGRG